MTGYGIPVTVHSLEKSFFSWDDANDDLTFKTLAPTSNLGTSPYFWVLHQSRSRHVLGTLELLGTLRKAFRYW